MVDVFFVEQHGEDFANKAANERVQGGRGVQERPEEMKKRLTRTQLLDDGVHFGC
jgi:hypothetical protein